MPSPGPYDLFGNSISLSTGLDIGVHQSSYLPPSSGPSFATLFVGQAADSDTDGDGVAALIEYALGGSLSQNDATKLPSVIRSGNLLLMTLVERVNDPKLSVQCQWSRDLVVGGWSSVGVTRSVDADQNGVPPGFEKVTYQVDCSGSSKAFMRILMSINN